MKVLFNEIKWDMEDEVINLPETLEADIDFEDIDIDNEDEVSDFLSDWLSDEYGYCHYGFDYKLIGY